jgi:hypothetical protein
MYSTEGTRAGTRTGRGYAAMRMSWANGWDIACILADGLQGRGNRICIFALHESQYQMQFPEIVL